MSSRSFGIGSRFFFSKPATMRSTALVKSVRCNLSAQRGLVDQIGEVGAGEARVSIRIRSA